VEKIGDVQVTPQDDLEVVPALAQDAFLRWRDVPAPKRGELIRIFGEVLRQNKEPLAQLITLETGKILAESHGEVQEMIDICDFAVGLSRQLYGLTIASERPGHRMMEQWHPLGPVLVISAFNFPAAVWAWNFALAIVCGNPVVWKPSEKTPLTARRCGLYFGEARSRFAAQGHASYGSLMDLLQVVYGGKEEAEFLVKAPEVRLVSATGSCAMGRAVKRACAEDIGKRTLLELGGNNAMIVAPSADLDLAERAILFSAVGTAGQRCTSLRRLFVHNDVFYRLRDRLVQAYQSIVVGDPREPGTLVGPLIDVFASVRMSDAIRQAVKEGGKVLHGGDTVAIDRCLHGAYRRPALIAMPSQSDIVREETFAPILYLMPYVDLDAAIALQNDVPQGLSSSIFTNDVREAERFMAASGSDCGIANVNIGPSGAEIGGAFGGEKDTGGGRESGSDSWRQYMRRATNTVNFSSELPLAQGITFGKK
jgi:aldehyde dehydrogenase (NAD+)